jgi:hypothetical protein
MLLLAAMVGAIVIARRRDAGTAPRTVVGPRAATVPAGEAAE